MLLTNALSEHTTSIMYLVTSLSFQTVWYIEREASIAFLRYFFALSYISWNTTGIV